MCRGRPRRSPCCRRCGGEARSDAVAEARIPTLVVAKWRPADYTIKVVADAVCSPGPLRTCSPGGRSEIVTKTAVTALTQHPENATLKVDADAVCSPGPLRTYLPGGHSEILTKTAVTALTRHLEIATLVRTLLK